MGSTLCENSLGCILIIFIISVRIEYFNRKLKISLFVSNFKDFVVFEPGFAQCHMEGGYLEYILDFKKLLIQNSQISLQFPTFRSYLAVSLVIWQLVRTLFREHSGVITRCCTPMPHLPVEPTRSVHYFHWGLSLKYYVLCRNVKHCFSVDLLSFANPKGLTFIIIWSKMFLNKANILKIFSND